MMEFSKAMEFLLRDSGRVPGSRYGQADDCAEYAYMCAEIERAANGTEITEDGLDHYMSLAVNNADGIAELIRDHGTPGMIAALEADGIE